MRALIRFFANNHTLANVLTFLFIALGIGALSIIQRDNFPSVDLLEMNITTRYPGASPEDVELNVTNVIEEELKEVDGIDKYTSYSMENISIIHVWLDRSARDFSKVKTDVRDAVSRASKLPDEVDEDPLVEEITTATAIPIIEVGLTGDVPYGVLRENARMLEKRLLDVTGVGSLTKYGYLDREIKVELDQDKLEQFQVPAHQVVSAIQNRNIRATGGSFESYTSEKNIVTLAEFEDPMEVGQVIVKVREGGSTVRVSDLAMLRDDFEPAKVLSRMNGQPAISFLVFKKETADIIRTVRAVRGLIEEFRPQLSTGVSIEYSNDKSRLVSNRLRVVISNGLLGLILVGITLGLFLDWRSAFWVALSIPVILLGTIFMLPVFGAFLDTIAMGAMILVIGIIVDDGIVVAENIWKNRESGLPPLEAATEGASQVFKPVLTTILTTALAFLPMFFMTGTLGDFVFVIPLVVVIALGYSLVDTMFIMPAHLIAGVRGTHGTSPGRTGQWFTSLRSGFTGLLKTLLRMRYRVIVVFMALLIGCFMYAARYMDFILFPTQSADEFYVLVELPSGSSLEHTAESLAGVENIIRQLPENELASMVTRIGTHGQYNMGENENWAHVGVYLTPFAGRERNADEIVAELRTELEKLDGFSNFAFVVEDIERDDKRGKEQIGVDLDYLRLAENSLSVADVAKSIRLAYDGEIVTSVRYGEEDVDFRVIMDEEARSSINVLRDLVIPNAAGRFVSLDEVASFHVAPGPSNFYHFNNERTITVTADVQKGTTTPLLATNAVVSQVDLNRDWKGMRLVVGGEAEESTESMGSLAVAFAGAAIGIYLVLVLLFNSLVQPLIVMFAVPFGLIGVILAFALHQQSLGFLAMLGVIGLMGIVVNDSLILVNLFNQLREKSPGLPVLDAVLEAAASRFRPILLTSITTVAGLLPMAYGVGGADPFSAPMALAMGYGIMFATPLTLVFLPCALVIGDDLRGVLQRKKP
jgi:multidrug efflux pump subunit AcrB